MIKSQFAVLMSNLFIIGGLLCNYMLPPLIMLMLAFLWFISAIYLTYVERQQLLRLSYDLERYNKEMEKRFNNGNRTNKRR